MRGDRPSPDANLEKLHRRRQGREKAYLEGLHLSQCQGLSMREIAPKIGLNSQVQVTRLLNLKRLRLEVRHLLIRQLYQRLSQEALKYISIERLHAIDQTLETLLTELVDDMMAESAAQTQSAQPCQQISRLMLSCAVPSVHCARILSNGSIAIKPCVLSSYPNVIMTYSSQCQLLDLDPDQGTTVHLTTGAVNWAVEVCQDEIDTNHQWFCFLRAMAIRGLQQWLDQGAEALPLDYSRETAPQSGVNCQVKGFRLCLVVQGSLSDGVISIPRYTLKDPLNFAHLYILAEVQEEADQVKILAGLRRDRLVSFKESGNLALSRKGHYHVPLEDWDLSPEDLLLYLHCLNPRLWKLSILRLGPPRLICVPSRG